MLVRFDLIRIFFIFLFTVLSLSANAEAERKMMVKNPADGTLLEVDRDRFVDFIDGMEPLSEKVVTSKPTEDGGYVRGINHEFLDELEGYLVDYEKICEKPEGPKGEDIVVCAKLHRLKQITKLGDNVQACKDNFDTMDMELDRAIINAARSEINLCSYLSYNNRVPLTNSGIDKEAERMNKAEKASNFQDRLALDSMKKSVDSYVAFLKRSGESLDIPKVIEGMCQVENSWSQKIMGQGKFSSTCNDEHKKFLKKELEKADAANNITELNSAEEVKQALHKKLTELNEIKEKYAEEYRSISKIEDEKEKEAAKEQVDAKVKMEWQASLQTVENKGIDELLMTEALNKNIMDAEGGLGNIINPTIEQVREALKEAKTRTLKQVANVGEMQRKKREETDRYENGNMRSKDYYAKRKEDLSLLMRSNPLSVGDVLSDDAAYSDVLCDVNQEMESNRASEAFWDTAFLVAGVGIGVVFIATGFGAGPAIAAIAAVGVSGVYNVAEVTRQWNRRADAKIEREYILASYLAGDKDNMTFTQLEQEREKARVSNFAANLTLGLAPLDLLGIGTAVRGARLAKMLSQFDDVPSSLTVTRSLVNKISADKTRIKGVYALQGFLPNNIVGGMLGDVSKLPWKQQKEFMKELQVIGRAKDKAAAISKFVDEGKYVFRPEVATQLETLSLFSKASKGAVPTSKMKETLGLLNSQSLLGIKKMKDALGEEGQLNLVKQILDKPAPEQALIFAKVSEAGLSSQPAKVFDQLQSQFTLTAASRELPPSLAARATGSEVVATAPNQFGEEFSSLLTLSEAMARGRGQIPTGAVDVSLIADDALKALIRSEEGLGDLYKTQGRLLMSIAPDGPTQKALAEYLSAEPELVNKLKVVGSMSSEQQAGMITRLNRSLANKANKACE